MWTEMWTEISMKEIFSFLTPWTEHLGTLFEALFEALFETLWESFWDNFWGHLGDHWGNLWVHIEKHGPPFRRTHSESIWENILVVMVCILLPWLGSLQTPLCSPSRQQWKQIGKQVGKLKTWKTKKRFFGGNLGPQRRGCIKAIPRVTILSTV